MPRSNVRVVGGGNTYVTISWGRGSSLRKVSYITRFQEKPGSPQGQVKDIQGIGDQYPKEIITPYAMTSGEISFEVWQLWGMDEWVSLFAPETDDKTGKPTYANSPWGNTATDQPVDIVQVWEKQRTFDEYVTVKKYELDRKGDIARVKEFVDCVISGITASDDVQNNTMDKTATITMKYRYVNTSYGGFSEPTDALNVGRR